MDDLDAATAATLAASRALLGVVAASLAPVLDQVTLPQFRVLVLLSELKRARIGDLAERLGVHPSTFSRTASRMVDADLVRRVESPHSRREILVELTPRGRRTVAGVVKRRATLIRDILSALEPAEREDLLSAFAAFTGAAHEPGYERLAGLLGI